MARRPGARLPSSHESARSIIPSDNRQITVGGGVDVGLTNLFEEDFKTRTFYLFLAWETAVGG